MWLAGRWLFNEKLTKRNERRGTARDGNALELRRKHGRAYDSVLGTNSTTEYNP